MDEASQCPICKVPGNKYAEQKSGNEGGRVLLFRCGNTSCRWGKDPEDLGWLVEVDENGTIPERRPGEKQFPPTPVPQAALDQAQAVGEQLSRPVKDLRNTPEVGQG